MPSEARLLLLDRNAVHGLLTPDDVTQAVREAFELHSRSEGRVFPVIREALAAGVFGIKAGEVRSQALLGFKAAEFWPANRQQGGEPHQATIVLVGPATGRPQCIIDGNAITALRTGAAGPLGLAALARRNSQNLTVFGTGVQARSQLNFALRTLPGLTRLRYGTSGRKPDPDFESHDAGRCDIQCAVDANVAVAEADVVITAMPGDGPLFDADAVRPGTHLSCVGADTRGKRELPEGLLPAARLIVDDRQQAEQLGELQWSPTTAAVELGDLLTGRKVFARFASDITIFDMTGLALQDPTVARHIHQRASASGAGCNIA